MSELAKQIADWKAARQRMEASAIPIAQEVHRQTQESAAGLRLKAFVARRERRALEEQELERLKAERIIALAIAERYSVQSILRLVAHVHRLSIADIKGPRRSREVVNARFHAVHLLLTLRRDLSLVFIGKALGGRDHSTVLNARKQVPKMLEACPLQVAEVERLMPKADGGR